MEEKPPANLKNVSFYVGIIVVAVIVLATFTTVRLFQAKNAKIQQLPSPSPASAPSPSRFPDSSLPQDEQGAGTSTPQTQPATGIIPQSLPETGGN